MYGVDWLESAVLKLGNFWVRAESSLRAEITAATHRIDETLKLDPLGAGESREDGRRIYIDLPVVVVYEVDIDRHLVTVLDAVVPERRGGEPET